MTATPTNSSVHRSWVVGVVIGVVLATAFAGYSIAHTNIQYFDDSRNCGDRTIGHDHRDEFYLRGGNDCAYGRGGDDALHMGGGDDYGYGESGPDRVLGDPNTDYLEGNTGNDEPDGGDGGDTVFGNSDYDAHVRGGAGGDSVYTNDNVGDETAHGGLGSDVCRIDPGDHPEDCNLTFID